MTEKKNVRKRAVTRRAKPGPKSSGKGAVKGRIRDLPGKCPSCGRPVGGRSKTCPACGAILDPAAVRQA